MRAKAILIAVGLIAAAAGVAITGVAPSLSATTSAGSPAQQQLTPPRVPSEAELKEAANRPAETVPTGPELSLEEVRTIASRTAHFAQVGESTSPPATMSVTRAELGTVEEVLSSEGSQPGPTPTQRLSPPNRRFPVFVVVVHGEFHSLRSPPPGKSPSRYGVLTVAIDAHNGFVHIRDLGDNTPDLEKIGPTTELR
jgi:hypothetical protein